MVYEIKPNIGSLFKNSYKTAGDKKPDYTGFCVIEGNEYKMYAWINTARNGTKYMYLNFQLIEPINRSESVGVDFEEDKE
jgi:hypothetical protein